MLRQLNREQSEAQLFKSRYESKDLVSDTELEELRQKQIAEITIIQQELDAVQARYYSLEKQRARISAEFEATQADAKISFHKYEEWEKKQRSSKKLQEEWGKRVEDLQAEMDAVQSEARKQAAEAHRLQTAYDALQEQVEAFRRENKQLSSESHDLQVKFKKFIQI